jgi:poly-gamma-glutamate capsule biosynthesis protein CapA/YwtB (metallophosphatase superfamily)
VGDILMHQDVKRAAKDCETGFQGLWADLKPVFDGADLLFGNLETPIAPTSGVAGRPFVFNAPGELPKALQASGFTILSTANNHAYDQGAKGVLETLERLEAVGLVAIGSGRDRAQAEGLRILERKGIRIAMLAASDLFNNDLNGAGKGPWVVRLQENTVVEAIRSARSQADLVIVSIHWGNEYEHRPSPRQRAMAAKMIGAGADLIIGHHPHVLQPLEWLEAEGRKGAVAFSLGNFISNQDRKYDDRMAEAEGDNRDGAALVAVFCKDPKGSVGLESVRAEPLWTVNNWTAFSSGKAQRREIRVVRALADGGILGKRGERIRQTLSPSGGFATP